MGPTLSPGFTRLESSLIGASLPYRRQVIGEHCADLIDELSIALDEKAPECEPGVIGLR